MDSIVFLNCSGAEFFDPMVMVTVVVLKVVVLEEVVGVGATDDLNKWDEEG